MPSCTMPTFSKMLVTLSATQPAMLFEICQASGSAIATTLTPMVPRCHSHSDTGGADHHERVGHLRSSAPTVYGEQAGAACG